MRPHTLTAFVCLVLGASTVWLAVELRVTRKELAELRGSREHVTTPTALVPGTERRESPSQPNPVSMPPPPDEAQRTRDDGRAHSDFALHAANVAHNARVRAWLKDPKKRAKVLADSRKSREQEIPRQLLDLSDVDYSRLVDTLAASQVRHFETVYHCSTDPACDVQSALRTQTQADRLELIALLGDERAQRLEIYRDNHMERNVVASFRGGLADSMRLSDAQAEKLAEALGEERRRMLKEWQQRGEDVSVMANSWGLLNFPATENVEQRLAEATEFQRRQRDRAAEVLTAAQLDAFIEQQDQMLEIARGSWELEQQADKSR